MAGWHWCIRTFQRIICDLGAYEDGSRRIQVDVLDAYQVQLELVYRKLICAEVLGNLTYQAAMGIGNIHNALSLVRHLLESSEQQMETRYHAPITKEERGGKPRLYIPRKHLAHLLEKRCTVPHIANILRVSVRTVRRRMTEYDLSVHALYSDLTDQELELVV